MWSFYVQMFAFLTVGIYLGDKISSGDAVIFLLSVLLTAILRKPVLKKFFSARVFILLIAVFGNFELSLCDVGKCQEFIRI